MAKPANPLVSICIPCYKAHPYAAGSIRSAAAQDFPDFEVVINDESADRVIEPLARAAGSDKVVYRHVPGLRGILPKLNDFLESARGEWMLVLCDDDELDPRYLATLLPHAGTRPDAALIRCRYRNGFDHEELREPGEEVEVTILLPPTSNLFDAGHRIRIDVSSSNFPRLDRNPNTGEPIGRHTRMQIAEQTVFGGEVVLPVIPS